MLYWHIDSALVTRGTSTRTSYGTTYYAGAHPGFFSRGGVGKGGGRDPVFFYKGLHSELKLSSSYKFDTISDYNCFKTEIRKLEGRIEASQIERGEEKDHMQCS